LITGGDEGFGVGLGVVEGEGVGLGDTDTVEVVEGVGVIEAVGVLLGVHKRTKGMLYVKHLESTSSSVISH
jgi:hypothetical protein